MTIETLTQISFSGEEIQLGNDGKEADLLESKFENLVELIKEARIARQAVANRKNSPNWASISQNDKELIEKVLLESQELRGYIKIPEKFPIFRTATAAEVITRGKQAYYELAQMLRTQVQNSLSQEVGERVSLLDGAISQSIQQVIATFKQGTFPQASQAVLEQVKVFGADKFEEIEKEKLGEEVLKYEKIVWHEINKLSSTLFNSGISQNDAAQVGRLAVIEALNNHDPTKGRLSAYLFTIVKGRLKDLIRQSAVPSREMQKKIKSIKDFELQFEAENGRVPTFEEIAFGTGVEIEKVAEVKSVPKFLRIGNLLPGQLEKIANEHHISLKDEDPLASPEEYLLAMEETREQESELRRLHAAINLLPPRESQIVKSYFFENKPLWQIAEDIGLSASRVSQLSRRALKKLQTLLTQPVRLKDFLKRMNLTYQACNNNGFLEGISIQRGKRREILLGPLEQLELKKRIENHRKTAFRKSSYKPVKPDDLEVLLELYGKYLNPRQIRVLRLRAGLEDGEFWTQKQVGEEIGVSAVTVYNMENRALRLLKAFEPSVFNNRKT